MGLALAALAALLTAIEMVLVLVGVLPLLAEKAPANIAFSLATFLIAGYAGWRACNPKAGAAEGLKVGGAVALVLLASVGISRIVRVPILGIQVTDAVLIVILSLSVLFTLTLSGLAGACAGYASLKLKKEKQEMKKGKTRKKTTAR